ncbi:SpoIIE family protein phosphatase [Rathayibacter iranicus]|uniref:PPM-type phosphatase domain-containing protein n=2 Tax=Rathayibacter iranicus TaxID=59737 RepID=A0AAD1ADG2_9MICO|nr:SpoIIE family protein phosphatase [Rathayibacter iranicus]AZZ55402.1 hypothetical protein C7V51_05520 [Rathayibacter iranicus]PPI48190.1 hypothetical protein C5E09_04590 [Rathayibacter iranicus]PPI61406.1 hypothetical protein C5E08_05500 [Rathayibacter iranicus]PPI72650.1 hypothetical protein C5E01_05125 [Rathayibacter iranicus]PWJ65896.1 stage II sporulation protein E [Rathayibacter iranicus NCPPB 2253 = VKM Ac-1602]
MTDEERAILDELGRWAERVAEGGWSIDAMTTPLHDVAGDYTAWRFADGVLTFELVDVMGKGVSAALVAAAIHSAFQARPSLPPADAVTAVNHVRYRAGGATRSRQWRFRLRGCGARADPAAPLRWIN